MSDWRAKPYLIQYEYNMGNNTPGWEWARISAYSAEDAVVQVRVDHQHDHLFKILRIEAAERIEEDNLPQRR